MAQSADTLDLTTLDLRPGEGRVFDLRVRIEPLSIGDQTYTAGGGSVDALVDVSRTVSGYAMRLRYEAPLVGACMRCLGEASPTLEVEAREVDQPGGGEELRSPYLEQGRLELGAWTRDALVLALPTQVVCREDCPGLCPICGANLNDSDPERHHHEQDTDPRWAALKDWRSAG